MIEGMIRKIMRGATLRFAKNEDVKATEINIVIHSKGLETEEGLVPSIKYYYTVKGIKKLNEDGKTKDLDFKFDILDSKFDFMNKEGHASFFLLNKLQLFAQVYEEKEASIFNLFLIIRPKTDEALDFDVCLFMNKTMLKKISLEDITNIG